ncbi:MAG: sulfatase-like hydrolase/transferase, partial [Armatimonadota bacterium]
MVPARPNVIVVMSDTLRTAYLGCYGNDDVHTPNIDEFAGMSVKFNRAYPEALPTVPVRRAMFTGRRAFPFHDYTPVPWDIVTLPGWEPMDPKKDTIAENLAAAGYHTGMCADTLPMFAPGFNFQRGFWQWEYIRGMQQDRWRSVHTVTQKHLDGYQHYISPEGRNIPEQMYSHVPYHIANKRGQLHEQDTTTAQTFQWAMDFLEDNRGAEPFYLYVDSFAPHEPWEAPPMY